MGRLAMLDGKRHEVEVLRERHKEILRLIALGLENKAIAEKLDVTPQMVSYVRNGKLGSRMLEFLSKSRDEQTAEILEDIHALAPLAVETMEEIMTSDCAKDADRLKAAMDILDRSGYGAVQKFDVRQTLMAVSAQDIEDMKRRAEEALAAKKAASVTIDVKSKELDLGGL